MKKFILFAVIVGTAGIALALIRKYRDSLAEAFALFVEDRDE